MLVSGGDASRGDDGYRSSLYSDEGYSGGNLVPGSNGSCFWVYPDNSVEPATCPPDPNLNPAPPAGCYDAPDQGSPYDTTICLA